METLKNIMDEWDGVVNGPLLLSSLVKKSGLLMTGLATPASHNAYDLQEVYIDTPSGQFVDLNGTYTVADVVNSTTKQFDVKSCIVPVELDPNYGKGLPNGINTFIDNKLPAYVEGLGKTIASQGVYGTNVDSAGFTGIREFCVDNSRVSSAYSSGAATGSDLTSILVVRWDTQGCTWLYNKNDENNEMGMFNIEKGEQTVISPTSTTRKKIIPIDTYANLALKIADPTCVWSIINVKVGSNDITAQQLQEAIDNVKGNAEDTFIYCNRNGRQSINKINDAKLQTISGDGSYSNIVTSFNGIRIVLEENITDTETYIAV